MPPCWWAGEAAVHFRLVPRGLQQLQKQEKGNPGSLPGECGGRGGVRAPGSVWPGSAYRLRGDRPVRARAGPGGKELSEWHFLSDLRVLGTVGSRILRGGATELGSEIPDPPPALARYPDCGGSQRLRAPGVVGRSPGPNSGAAGRQEKVPGSGKVAGRRPALPLQAAASWVTLSLRALASVSSATRRGPRSPRP